MQLTVVVPAGELELAAAVVGDPLAGLGVHAHAQLRGRVDRRLRVVPVGVAERPAVAPRVVLGVAPARKPDPDVALRINFIIFISNN